MLYSIVGILVIILDQATKFWVSNTLFGTDVVRFIPGVISLVNVHNDGAAFSFLSGSGARIYFIIATGVFVLLVVIALATNFISGRLARWSLVLVAAGGLGNMIDRIIYGYVQDMFKVELFNFAIFNVADVFITVFAIVFALAMIFGKPDEDIEDEFEDEEEEEYEEPQKKARKLRKKDKAAALEEPEDEPAEKKSSVRSARKARQDKYEKEYEEYKAQQRAAMGRKKKNSEPPAPAAEEPAFSFTPAAEEKPAAEKPAAAKPAAQEDDPFAAWERANARAEARQGDSLAGRVMEREAPKPAAPKAEPAQARPAAQPKPAAKPVSADEFDLDDILAEFK